MTDAEWAYVTLKGFLIFITSLVTIGWLVGTIEQRELLDFKYNLKYFICIFILRVLACLVQPM